MVFVIYRDGVREFRWRLWAANHADILTDSGEGYKRLADCEHAVSVIKGGAHAATVQYAKGVK